MQLKKSSYQTNGSRHRICIQKGLLSKKNNIIKQLAHRCISKGGRNSTGRITIRHQGSGTKVKYHKVLTKNNLYCAIILAIIYSPRRSAFISLNFDLNSKIFFKTLATNSLGVGSIITCENKMTDFYLGCRTTIQSIPTGSIFNSLNVTNKIKFARSAGTYCQLLQKSTLFAKIRLPSGKIITVVPQTAFGTLGIISNILHNKEYLGKAGKNRLCGVRPSVRGIAMNPVDHPHGGRTNGGIVSVTPWGIPTKGKPTVKQK